MSNIVINDLTETKTLGEKAMSRVHGGFSLDPSIPDVPGIPGATPAPIKLFDPFPTYDAEKFKEELLERMGPVPSTPDPLPGEPIPFGPLPNN